MHAVLRKHTDIVLMLLETPHVNVNMQDNVCVGGWGVGGWGGGVGVHVCVCVCMSVCERLLLCCYSCY